jgi:hypothetical protein
MVAPAAKRAKTSGEPTKAEAMAATVKEMDGRAHRYLSTASRCP